MIIHPKNDDILYLKQIWKDTFADSDFYIDLVFNKKISLDNSYIYIINNRPVSMMYFTQYDINFYNEILKAGYVFGAATLPQYRGKGIMGEMLERAFADMKNEGDDFSVLIPSSDKLYDYYGKFGYATVFFRKRAEYKREEVTGKYLGFNSVDNSESIYGIYKKIAAQNKIAVLQTKDTYDTVIRIHKEAGGEALVIDNKDAFCFAKKRGSNIYVKEIFYQNEDLKPVAFSLFSRYPETQSVIIESIAGETGAGNGIKRTGMAKILNKSKVYEAYKSFSNKEVSEIEDETIFCEKIFLSEDNKPYMNMMLD